jgi:hypothetical protein
MTRLVFAAAAFAGLAFAQPGDWSQRFQVKFGTPPPAEQARLRTQAAQTAYRQDVRPVTPEYWRERWFRAKFGRPSPPEEARIQAERANTAYRQDTPPPPDPNAWLRGYMRAKFGRELPQR